MTKLTDLLPSPAISLTVTTFASPLLSTAVTAYVRSLPANVSTQVSPTVVGKYSGGGVGGVAGGVGGGAATTAANARAEPATTANSVRDMVHWPPGRATPHCRAPASGIKRFRVVAQVYGLSRASRPEEPDPRGDPCVGNRDGAQVPVQIAL